MRGKSFASLWLTLFALVAFFATPARAVNVLTATPSSVTLTCNTTTGPSAAVNVVVKPTPLLTGSNTHVVTVGSVGNGITVTPPSVTTLSTANQSAGLTYSVKINNGCASASTGTVTFRFSAGGTPDVTVSVALTVTATATPLTPTPSPVVVTCTRTPGSPATYAPGPAQTVTVKSAATGGTPYTIDTVTNAPPAWLTVTPTTSQTATTTGVTFTVRAAAGCGAFAAGTSNATTLYLLNTPAPAKTIPVTLLVVPPTTLTATPSPAALTYVKNSGSPGRVDIAITSSSSPAPFFSVDSSTLPLWLTVDSMTGTTPKSLRFSSTSAADSMAPGVYSASVRIKVSGQADLVVPISALINNPPPKLTVGEGLARNLNWTIGTALPTPYVTLLSSDSPLPYTIDVGGPLSPIVAASSLKGLAYSFGTPIPITFDPNIFAAAQPGTVLVGTVSITWGSPATTTVVTFNITILPPGAAITDITPPNLNTAPAGTTYTVTLTGSGFVPSSDPAQRTKVGIVTGSTLAVNPNITYNVVNISSIILTIIVPAVADTALPFAPTGAGGNVTLGVCNPNGSTCSTATGTAILTIGSGPIINAVSSSSSFVQVTEPTLPTIAPYDLISVFGSNFCSSGGRGCTAGQVLYSTPDPLTLAYPTTLSPDAVSSTQRLLSVTFQTHATPPVAIATAPLLFASNNQINVVVPAALSAQVGNTIDMVVNFGYGTGATMLSSAPYSVTVAATNPGIFTVGSDGRGDAATLGANWNLITSASPAGMRSTAADSDTIQIFMTGLGVPDSTAANSTGGAWAWSDDCISVANYLSSLNSAAGSSLTTLDGVIVSSSLVAYGRTMPCILDNSANLPTVTIGGVAGTVTFAGWAQDSIGGLYRLDVLLPGTGGGPYTSSAGTAVSSITVPVQLPVVVTAGGLSSQTGVNLWVAPRLKVTGPSGSGLTGTVGVAWASSNNSVTATEGTSPYRYSVTSGLLPTGLALNPTTGAITGTPAANTSGAYLITVTATDSANFPVTGTVSFQITIAGGLVVSSTGTAPYTGVYATADPALTTASATGGTYPYTYALTAPSTVPVGLTLNSTTGVLGMSNLTPAGNYHTTITATDSTAGTPLTGSLTFDTTIALKMAKTTVQNATAGSASNISTISATGNTGTVTYALDATSTALGWITLNTSTGVLAVTTGCTAGTYSVTITGTDGTAAPGAATAGTGTITFSFTVS